MGDRGLIVLACGSLLAGPVGGCDDGEEFAPAAEPAVSPPLVERPAGETFRVGSEPEGLVVGAWDGLAAVVTRDPSRLTLVDLDRRRVLERVPLPATARHLGLGADGRSALVPVEQSDELIEVGFASGRRRTIAVGDHPHDAAPAAGRIFVGNEFADTVSVVEGGEEAATLPAAAQPGGVAAAAGRVAVVAVAERVLEIYDARTLEPLGSAGAGDGPTHVVAAGDRAWVADTDGEAVLGFAIDGAPALLTTTPVAGAPYGIAVDAERDRLWVTLTACNEAVEYDLSGARPRELGRYPTLQQPNSVAVDPRDGTAAIAGRAAGRLQLIEGAGR